MNPIVKSRGNESLAAGTIKMFQRGIITHVEARTLLAYRNGIGTVEACELLGPAIESVESHLL